MGVRFPLPTLVAVTLTVIAAMGGGVLADVPTAVQLSYLCPPGLIPCGTGGNPACCAQQPATASASDCVHGWCIPANNPPTVSVTISDPSPTPVSVPIISIVSPAHPSSLEATPVMPVPISTTGTGTGTLTTSAASKSSNAHTASDDYWGATGIVNDPSSGAGAGSVGGVIGAHVWVLVAGVLGAL